MKNRVLAWIMAAVLTVGLLPATALAADLPDVSITDIPDGLEIEGTVVTDYTGDMSHPGRRHRDWAVGV